jgi:hypothetical protein
MRILWTVGPFTIIDLTLFETQFQDHEDTVIVRHEYIDTEDEDEKKKGDDGGSIFGS